MALWLRTLPEPPGHFIAHEGQTSTVYRSDANGTSEQVIDGSDLCAAMERVVIECLLDRGCDLLNVGVPYAAIQLSEFGLRRRSNTMQRTAEVRRREVANG